MQTDDARTDNDALIETAQDAVKLQELDPTKLWASPIPITILDGESHLPSPHRPKGQVAVYDAASLVAYFNQVTKPASTAFYADREHQTITAIFNDHGEHPGWRDHRALLTLRLTPEWRHWKEQDGRLRSQVEFAEHIEQGLLEITEPDGATILELAQTFEANQKVAFKSATTLADGARQLTYQQVIEARAGQSGQLTIPKELVLALAPFEGSPPFKLVARLRYRIQEEALKIGYTLVRPHDVLNAAFADVVAHVENQSGITVLLGAP